MVCSFTIKRLDAYAADHLLLFSQYYEITCTLSRISGFFNATHPVVLGTIYFLDLLGQNNKLFLFLFAGLSHISYLLRQHISAGMRTSSGLC
jgi:hypothetical protein